MSPNDLVPVARAVETAETCAAGRLDATALQPNIGALMHDVARLMRRRFERRARQTGLSITRQQARAVVGRPQRRAEPGGGRNTARYRADRAGAPPRQAARGRPT